ncbi:rhophilin-1 [Ochotona curzoniae]|uniref:rhophilin-1 n=1 Tax=Ochotona curzoniae TaxID=130825 RepID=UPI001B34C705|nr:rhophilin-1 [Ochotona curzoniae]
MQTCRARIHQQMEKELQLRAGAENLYRATSNSRVRESAALELGRVNCSLQLLKEELQELGRSPDAAWPSSPGIAGPMIPLGLKETKQLDWATPLQELISGHFGEDGASYTEEIQQLARLRQAARTPSRDEAGLELLATYYQQLCLLDARFCTPARSLGPVFHWYDSLTGLPAQQRALAFEKGSVLFNMGALHTQIGAGQDRSCTRGAWLARQAFQNAMGTFSVLRANFSQAPSPDMSAACLCTLEGLMAAQAQECAFEGLLLASPAAHHDHLAQEAAQVAAEYRRVQGALAQAPARSCLPASWTALVQVKAEHFKALAHYHAATALSHCAPAAQGAPPPHVLVLPTEPEERRRLAKAHLRRAILGHEEALRLHRLGRPRAVDLLQAAISHALRRSLASYTQLDREDDFCEVAEAPDILPKTQQKPEVKIPNLARVKVTDIFHRLGPLSVFSVKNRWRLVGPVHLSRGEEGFGLTLRGDSPVLIAAVLPGGRAAAAGLKEGDCIVAVNGQPCKWWTHTEVVAQLRAVGDAGASLQVVTPLPGPAPLATGDQPPALAKRTPEDQGGEPIPAQASPHRRLGWSRPAKRGKRAAAQPRAPTLELRTPPTPS